MVAPDFFQKCRETVDTDVNQANIRSTGSMELLAASKGENAKADRIVIVHPSSIGKESADR
ncbi:hypothetical protein M514_06055 [Trichuris suis]|uniref:Uncharacterized protein n=1 Tax=Trichuris suis TaxID=68888 RepID=A0A085NML5_9BILA|nr:hypothetical protein M513_06055 [Trichuris suis]KFD70711.1 hypothetical protein M514_06055 [Trichuris suis]